MSGKAGDRYALSRVVPQHVKDDQQLLAHTCRTMAAELVERVQADGHEVAGSVRFDVIDQGQTWLDAQLLSASRWTRLLWRLGLRAIPLPPVMLKVECATRARRSDGRRRQ